MKGVMKELFYSLHNSLELKRFSSNDSAKETC